MTSTDKILKLIDNGNAGSILDDETLAGPFNELFKYGLIDYKNDKVIFTTKGMEARIIGVEKFISNLKNQDNLKDFSFTIQKKEFICFKMCLSLTLILLIVIIAVSLT